MRCGGWKSKKQSYQSVCAIVSPGDCHPVFANGGVQKMKRVNFVSDDTPMRGDLFLPTSYQVAEKLPAILVIGPWLNVKEQVATNYAQRLANRGFAAFVFDFRHWGESGAE